LNGARDEDFPGIARSAGSNHAPATQHINKINKIIKRQNRKIPKSPAKSLADVWRTVTRRQKPGNIQFWFNGLIQNPDECPG
jgi:hypothetical protein